MSDPIPDALALSTIADGSEIVASTHRNNYSAIQAFANAIRTLFAGGNAGQVLVVVDGTDTKLDYLSGAVLAKGKEEANVTSSGTTFAGGTDILGTALTFTADGTSDYLVRVSAPYCSNASSSTNMYLHVNLDGSDNGYAQISTVTAGAAYGCDRSLLIPAPSAGSHTVNVRMRVDSGTGTVVAGAGGSGNAVPILVAVEKL